MSEHKKNCASALTLLAGILWGLLGLFSRKLRSNGFGPLEITFVRMAVAFLSTAIPVILFRRDLLRIRFRDLWCFTGSGIISMLMFSVCYFHGLALTSLAVATVLLYTAPTFVVLLSALIFHDPITKKKIMTLLLAFAGYILVAGAGAGQSLSFKGFLFCLASGFFYSLYSIFGKLAIRRGYTAVTLVFYSFFFCSICCTFFVDWDILGDAIQQHQNVLWWMFGIGFVTAFLPYTLYSIGLSQIDAGKASILVSIELVAETVVGVTVFHEPIDLTICIGIVLVLLSIIVFNINKPLQFFARKTSS